MNELDNNDSTTSKAKIEEDGNGKETFEAKADIEKMKPSMGCSQADLMRCWAPEEPWVNPQWLLHAHRAQCEVAMDPKSLGSVIAANGNWKLVHRNTLAITGGLEMENWDQTPVHHNESGSQNVSTLAVAGGNVPLVEGHTDTRKRWMANLVTFSNKERLREQGHPPYCELLFKADGDVM